LTAPGPRTSSGSTTDAAPPRASGLARPDDVRRRDVLATLVRVSALNELQYRVNFFLQLFQSLVALATAVAVVALVYLYTPSLGGWRPWELMVVVGVHTALGGIIRALIQPSMQLLMEDIREGTLDHVLTKPVDAQLLISVRQFAVWKLVDVVVGAGVVAFALVQLRERVSLAAIAVFVLVVVLGAVIVYCFWLAITTGAFWLVDMNHAVELFNGLYQAGRWPVTLYPGWLRLMFTILVPLAFAITVPAQTVTGRATATTVGTAVLFTIAIVAATRWLWRLGVRNYSGASA
jgi:ABC-2 type transport system permease protein